MTDYLDQVRHQLDATRAQLRSAEDELAINRQRAARHTAVETALREVLATFIHKVHPGYAALQSQMIEVEAVDRWRSLLAQPAPRPPAPTGRPDASSITDSQLDALYAELDRLREGEADSDEDDNVTSPALFIRRWNRATGAERLRVVASLQAAATRGDRCLLTNHEQQLAEIRRQHTSAAALMAQVQQLGGQLTDATTRAVRAEEQYRLAMDGWNREADAHTGRLAAVQLALSQHLGRDTVSEAVQAALNGPPEQPVADTCHTVTIDGETIRVRGAGPLGPVGEIALAEVIRAAKRKFVADTAPTKTPRTHECRIREDEDGWHVSCTDMRCAGQDDVGSEYDAEQWAERHQAEATAEDRAANSPSTSN